MKKARLSMLILLLAVAASVGRAAEQGVLLSLEEPWGNLTAGKKQVLHVRAASVAPFSGKVTWQVSAGSAVLLRGERAVSEAEPRVAIDFETPPLKAGVAMRGAVSAAFVPAGQAAEKGRVDRTVWLFSEAPFGELSQWTKSLDIRLFDPVGRTAKVFDKAGITYTAVLNADAIGGQRDGLLVIGEGLSLREYRGLAVDAMKAARAGAGVLCLALADGAWPLPLTEEAGNPAFQSVGFRREDVVGELDKRLDPRGWAPDGRSIASTVAVAGERGPVAGTVQAGADGWPWIEMKGASGGGVLVLCGFAIVAKWEESPTPGYLLVKILERVGKGKQADRGTSDPR